MRRVEALHEARALHDRRRGAAADYVDVVSFRLILSQHLLRQPFRVATEKLYLNKRVFLLESSLDRANDLIDDQPGIKHDLAFFLCALDEKFFPIG